ncbi:hypothetical protein DFH07DRAFT_741795, partial [Mycena maculata]
INFTFELLTIFFFYAAAVWAQVSHIGFPLAGSNIKLGKILTVQLVRPVCLEPFNWSTACPVSQEATCLSPAGELGNILFVGRFNPTFLIQ